MPRTAQKAPQIARWQQERADTYKRAHGCYPEWYEVLLKIESVKRKAAAASRTQTGRTARDTSGDTDYESLLLLQIKANGLPDPKTQHRWHPTRRFRADFAYPDYNLLIEVQGGLFQGDGGGGHNRGASYEKDREKYNEAQLLGWRVLEFGPNHVTKGDAIRIIERALVMFSSVNKGPGNGSA